MNPFTRTLAPTLLALAITAFVLPASAQTPIATAKADANMDFVIDNPEGFYTIEGVVTTPNLRTTIEGTTYEFFYLQDTNDNVGIGLIYDSDNGVPDDALVTGQLFRVAGRVNQFNGLRYIRSDVPDIQITLQNAGPIPTPPRPHQHHQPPRQCRDLRGHPRPRQRSHHLRQPPQPRE